MDKKINSKENRIEWVVMNMKLRGSSLTREEIIGILNGDCVLAGSIEDHIIIMRLAELLPFMDMLLDLQEEFRRETLLKLYDKLSDGEEDGYRKITPVLFHLSYNPVLPQEINGELVKLFTRSVLKETDPIKKAVFIHNEIIRIYPFRNWNEELARAAMEYTLLFYGIDFCPITLSEQEYNQTVTAYLHDKEDNGLINNLKTNLLMMEEMKGGNFER